MRYNYMRRAFFLVLLFTAMRLLAQTEAPASMYWAVPSYMSLPAVSCDSMLRVVAFNRMQWVGIEGAPKTFFVTAQLPFETKGKHMGIGVSAINDEAGLFKTTILNANFAYAVNVWKGSLSLGATIGMVNQSFDGSGVYVPDGDYWDSADDALPHADVAGRNIDIGFGAYYQRHFGRKLLYTALGVTHLNEASIELDEYSYSEQKRTYYLLAGGNIPVVGTLYILQPSLLLKRAGSTSQFDLTMRATYNNRFWGGIGYRHDDAVVLMFGIDIQGIRLGYAYDIATSELAKASNGSHEIMASYSMKLDVGKKKVRPSKSIRIL